MNAKSKLWQALLALLILALAPRTFVSATDERSNQETNSQVYRDKTEYVRHILNGSLTDEWKIALLRHVFRAGMSPNEVASIWGEPTVCLGSGDCVFCEYKALPGTDVRLVIVYAINGAISFVFTDSTQGKSSFEILWKK